MGASRGLVDELGLSAQQGRRAGGERKGAQGPVQGGGAEEPH